jgi:O-antigen ligase
MPYLGIHLYIIGLYLRPQDWVKAVYQFPLDYVIFALIVLTGWWKVRDLPETMSRPQTRLFLLWLLWIPMSDLTNGLPAQAGTQFVLYFKFFLFYLCAALFVDSFSKLRELVVFILLMTGVLVVQGIYQWNVGVGWAGQPLGFTETKGYRIRWVGLWDGYNVLCLLFVVGMAFLFQFSIKPWPVPGRLLAMGLGAMTMYGIYLTKSRGGLIALVGVAALYLNDLVRSWVIKGAAVVVLGAGMAVGVALFGGTDDPEQSASKRVAMWGEGLEMVKYNPVFGIGKGEFRNYTNSLIAHNSYVEVAGETGIVGFFFWLGLNYVSVKGLWFARRQATDPRLRALGTGFLSALLGYLLVSFFITTEFDLLYILHALAGAYISLTGMRLSFTVRDAAIVGGLQLLILTGVYVTVNVYL